MKLYESIWTGSSMCHATGNEKEASGGWYTFVCKHGVIYASKLLFLGYAPKYLCLLIVFFSQYKLNIFSTEYLGSFKRIGEGRR